MVSSLKEGMSHALIDRILAPDINENGGGEDAAIVIARPPRGESNAWLTTEREGELAVDVYQTEHEVVIVAVIGGVAAGDISVEIHHDVVTIRGTRRNGERIPYAYYFTQECYWGPFSRTVVLPGEVQAESAEARFRQGVLRITLPKVVRTQSMSVPVRGDLDDE